MAAGAFDSHLYRDLFHDAAVARLFTDSAEIRAMLLVEGALARAQAEAGLIPETAAAFIQRAAREVAIDPAALAPETGQSAVPVPALVAAFRSAMQAPEHAAWVHWGATSQDIMDTGLVLRLRQVVAILDERLGLLLAALAKQAAAHRALPLAARTYGQAATPTSFGAVVAGWGRPLLRHRRRLAELRPRLLCVSLAGAASNLSAMGPEAPRVIGPFAAALDLGVPDGPWHNARDTLAEFAGWLALLAGSLAKIGEDLILMTQSGIGEVRLPGAGGSSTMPQKRNPVAPSLLVALGRFAAAQQGAMTAALLHRQQRDGAAWMLEWLVLPQLCLAAARALAVAQDLAQGLSPDAGRMRAGLRAEGGAIFAEALVFALARRMPRPEAQAAVTALCRRAAAEGRDLADLAREAWPDAELAAAFDPARQLGQAPAEADSFAAEARA